MGTPKTKNPKTADSPPHRKGAKTIHSDGPLFLASGSKTVFLIRPGDRGRFVFGTKGYEELLAYSRTLRVFGEANEPFIRNFPPGAQQHLEHHAAYCDKIQRSDIATRIRKMLSQAGGWI